jgi:putative DNA primase/helicase
LLNLIERFLGPQNVSGETIGRLHHREFSIANLHRKMVNIDADISSGMMFKNTGILKKLTGNDLQIGEYKFEKAFEFRNYAKLIFSCNAIPKMEDLTDASLRRLIIIIFKEQFFGDKEDPNLIEKLATEEEFSILLHELLSRLPRILEQGIRKVTNETMAETYEKYSKGSDPIKYFNQKAIVYALGSKVSKADMYRHYKGFCREKGFVLQSEQSFSRYLTERCHRKYGRFRIDVERVYQWIDVKLVDWKKAEEEKDQQSSLDNNRFSLEEQEVMR